MKALKNVMKKVINDIFWNLCSISWKKHDLNNNLPSLPEKMKTEEAGKLFVNLNDKFECVINIWNLKQALNLVLVLIKLEWLNLVKNLG